MESVFCSHLKRTKTGLLLECLNTNLLNHSKEFLYYLVLLVHGYLIYIDTIILNIILTSVCVIIGYMIMILFLMRVMKISLVKA